LQQRRIKAKLRVAQRAYRKTRKWKAWSRAYALRPDVKAPARSHAKLQKAKRRSRPAGER
jgi:hypothetical protein